MKEKLLLTLCLLSSVLFAQIKFEAGSIILNNNKNENVLIKNLDWKNSPSSIEIKYTEDAKPEILSIKDLKEFEIGKEVKYIKATVKIDKSSFDLGKLSYSMEPEYKEEEVFLKVMVEGKTNLYSYRSGNVLKFFIKTDNTEILPLDYKMYYINEDSNKYSFNQGYKYQLSKSLSCKCLDKSDFSQIKYSEKDISSIVVAYNKCENPESNFEYVNNSNKVGFNLNVRPRFISESYSFSNSYEKYSLANKNNFGFGIEAEFILPFNKNKWGIIIEPTYQYFKSEDKNKTVKIDYKSVELPFGVRYYFFLNEKNKLFANIQYLINFDSGSKIEFYKDGVKTARELDLKSNNSYALGFGYNYNSKFSLEARYIPTRNLLSNYNYWSSNYQTFSLILGYNLF